jgi:chitinase
MQGYPSAGLDAKIGVTPMIGINDVSSEVFTLADAQQLAAYVQTDPNVVRTSIWSVSRDNGATAGASYASPTSSGIAETSCQFSSIFEHA